MARPRSSGFDDQRDQILAAAAALFAARGYSAASMNDVARSCGISKATLYHYVRDKHDLLAQISAGHVARLELLVAQVRKCKLAPDEHLRALIERFSAAYASAQAEHRVLTEDVKFLQEPEREAVLGAQRRVVAAFAAAVAALRPDLVKARLTKPLAMLLFGMINWTFTWLQPGGTLTHATLAPIVCELFFGGLPAVLGPGRAPRPARSSSSSIAGCVS